MMECPNTDAVGWIIFYVKGYLQANYEEVELNCRKWTNSKLREATKIAFRINHEPEAKAIAAIEKMSQESFAELKDIVSVAVCMYFSYTVNENIELPQEIRDLAESSLKEIIIAEVHRRRRRAKAKNLWCSFKH